MFRVERGEEEQVRESCVLAPTAFVDVQRLPGSRNGHIVSPELVQDPRGPSQRSSLFDREIKRGLDAPGGIERP